MDTFSAFALQLALLACLFVLCLQSLQSPRFARRQRSHPGPSADETILLLESACYGRGRRKPAWVAAQVLRLKALAPNLSARTIAEVFNRRFEHSHSMTVGKTFVSDLLRKEKLEVLRLRRELKHRIPKPIDRNRVWGLDLTGKTDLTGQQRMILGLIDHGSRACLRLNALCDKSSWTILRELVVVFRRFGIPRIIRTDNEACFTSITSAWQHGCSAFGCSPTHRIRPG